MSKSRRIERDVLAVLSAATTSGNALVLGDQLERGLYVRTNKVLEALGGKWNRKAKAHIFEGDAASLVDSVILTGEVELPADFGFFPTPAPIVDAMLERADVRPGMLVLEPSAGAGAIAVRLRELETEVDCVEFQERYSDKLNALGFMCACTDFLTGEPVADYDRVVMNPPFAKRADIHHVLHAFKFLKPGGRLVSIMSAGVLFREDRLTAQFAGFVESHCGSILPLPEGSFEESGTGVNTVMVIVDRAQP